MLHYGFQNLDFERQQIRLLHVHPGEFYEHISATISFAYLGDHPKYEALSYVWGDPRVCLDITVDGQTVSITINLWAALRRRKPSTVLESYRVQFLVLTTSVRVRDIQQERVLWVDALCINQEDEFEKSHQVRLMTEIFRNTWRALAWLGEFEEDAALVPEEGLDACRDFGVTMSRDDARTAFQLVEKLSKMSTDGHFTVEEDEVPAGWVSVTRPEVNALNKLMELRWWSRIWTVQEFVLPPRVELVLGNIHCEKALELLASKREEDIWKHDRLSGNCCEAFIQELPDFPALLLYFHNQVASLRSFKRQLPLGHAISRFRSRDCADPRDKIFGLLGLTQPTTRQLVDYALDKKQIYTKCVRYDIFSTNSLRPLMRLVERDRDQSLPSWVPDLEAPVSGGMVSARNTLNLEMKYLDECDMLFSAGTQRSMELKPSSEDELRLGGRRVDSIRRIFQRPPPNIWQNGEGSVLIPRVRADWQKLLESDTHLDLSRYPSGGSFTEAFWRTCTCDVHVPRDRSMRRVTANDGEVVKKGLAQHGYALGTGINPRKTLFISHRGYIGLGSEDTQVGDVLYVLFGGNVPFLLREVPESIGKRGTHTFVGYTYVHGIMDGEVLEADIPDELVTIV